MIRVEVEVLEGNIFAVSFWCKNNQLIDVYLDKDQVKDLHKDLESALHDIWMEEYFPDE